MFTPKKPFIIIIPAFNEAQTVGGIVEQVKGITHCEVVVVDDASTDGTRDAARAAGATVLPLSINLGSWGAIRTGFRYAVKHGYETAVTMDADGQHSATAIPTLVEPIESDLADVVIGSCLQRGSRSRKLAWLFFRHLTGLGIEDLTSGFRAYNMAALALLLSEDTTLFDYQDLGVLLLLKKMGLRVTETAVVMKCRSSGQSRVFYSWGAVFRYLLMTGILSLSKLTIRP